MTFLPLALSFALLSAGAANWCLSLQEDLDSRIEIDRELQGIATDTSRSLESILRKNQTLLFMESLCVTSAILLQPAAIANIRNIARALARVQDFQWQVLRGSVIAKGLKHWPERPRIHSPKRSAQRFCTPGTLGWSTPEVLSLRSRRELAGIQVGVKDNKVEWRFQHERVRRRL